MPRALLVEADGGSRGNPGVAGYGALVRDATTGALLAERAAPLGRASNNVAEYSGLIAGLQAVLDLELAGDAEVTVRMDSKLVVEQMAGRWKVKHQDMRRLALQARDLVRQVEWAGGQVDFRWIPRADNAAADALSNDGMDGHTVRRDHGGAPADPDAPAFGEGWAPVAEVVLSTETTPTLEGSCRVVLVRHGVTEFTLARRLDGRGGADPELAELGLEQARAAAGAVRDLLARSEPGPVTVLTSALTRAQQTGAEIAAALGVEPSVDADWDEQSFGDWDGAAMSELAQGHRDELVRLRSDPDYARPGGESHRQLAARVSDAFARAVARGGTVVVASHRKPLMCVLAQVLGIDHERIWSIATAPTSLTALEVWPDGGVQVAFVNDVHHLQGLETA
ncbi:MAG: bifunctional RNase H/acid phosphatase [Ornithinimicrobium sp.]|uniref:bifunctional RNase H/acid phosphatase n=1 Tax=Ornithinimicrobium sp. TaxID=1977084 RepID=UPI003D9B5142